MKILSWNCRGLGNPSAVRALKKLLKTNCPDLVFLMETKLHSKDKKVKSVLSCGPLSHFFIVDCNINNGSRSGGLAVLWNDYIQIDFLQSNKMIVDMYITACNINFDWFATGFYGSPYYNQKHLTCATINDLYSRKKSHKWLIFGDFNLVLNNSEKHGGNGVDFNHTNLFNSTLNQCDLNDLGYQGYKFTWANNQVDSDHIKERLDRFCSNYNWLNAFPRHVNRHLLRYTSDHSPILLEFSDLINCRTNKHKTTIKRFEQVWTNDKDSHKV
jgi:exonuclease III